MDKLRSHAKTHLEDIMRQRLNDYNYEDTECRALCRHLSKLMVEAITQDPIFQKKVRNLHVSVAIMADDGNGCIVGHMEFGDEFDLFTDAIYRKDSIICLALAYTVPSELLAQNE